MNERIRELEKQCTTYHYGGLGTEFEYFDKEKFAELIVRECVAQLQSEVDYLETPVPGYERVFTEFVDGTIQGLKDGTDLIMQHFGVEQ